MFFPLAVFGAGMARPKDFGADRAAIELLQKQSKEKTGWGYEIGWTERNFRRLGPQKIPSTISFPTQDDYLRFLKKQAEARQFKADYDLIMSQCPELGGWAQSKPLQVISHSGLWPRLLNVCTHLQNNPRPGCYLRELPVVVDTKFIESHKGILSELLPLAAPLTVELNNNRFETKFGFRFKQPLVRMRFLDAQLAARLCFPIIDFMAPLDEFCKLPLGGNAVLIVENDMTFLTLPTLQRTIAICGAGDAAALLSNVEWLRSCQMFYWGDLDSHGFETLSNLRKHYPNVTSVMMDQATFAQYNDFAVSASATRATEKLNLGPSEQLLYEHLASGDILLEQERIPVAFSAVRLSETVVCSLIRGV